MFSPEPTFFKEKVMQFEDFKNESGLTFKNISSEEWRRYIYADGSSILIDEPLALNVSKNGHRLVDAAGTSHYIPKGWKHLKWHVKDGQPHFVT